jgi:hypothetical protein
VFSAERGVLAARRVHNPPAVRQTSFADEAAVRAVTRTFWNVSLEYPWLSVTVSLTMYVPAL